MGAGAAEIAELVSDVRERLPDLKRSPAPEEPEEARFRTFDSIVAFLKSASRSRPIMLVLDDLHWADRPSLLLLEFVARELGGARLLLVGTYRDVEDVGRFIEVAAGVTPPPGLVTAVHTQTEGNPFFVTEVVRLPVQEGGLTRAAQGEPVEPGQAWNVRIPEGVREVVGRRLDRLSARCNEVLTTAAVVGREFGLDQLRPLVDDLSDDRLLEVLEEALAARVVEELPRAVGRYQFTHALIQQTLAEELSTTRRVRLHARIAEALEGLYGAQAEAHAAELALHFSEAEAVLGTEKLVRYSLLAGERALAIYGWEEAVAHFQRAEAAKGGQPMDGETGARGHRLGPGIGSGCPGPGHGPRGSPTGGRRHRHWAAPGASDGDGDPRPRPWVCSRRGGRGAGGGRPGPGHRPRARLLGVGVIAIGRPVALAAGTVALGIGWALGTAARDIGVAVRSVASAAGAVARLALSIVVTVLRPFGTGLETLAWSVRLAVRLAWLAARMVPVGLARVGIFGARTARTGSETAVDIGRLAVRMASGRSEVHTMSDNLTRERVLSLIATVWVLGLMGFIGYRVVEPPPPEPTVVVAHWTTGHLTRDGLLREMAAEFNGAGHGSASGTRIVVEVYDAPSELQGKYLSELLIYGTRRDLHKEIGGYVVENIPDPTIVTPSSAHWLVTTNYEVGRSVVDLDAAKSIVRPVIGIVTYQEMARCLGWPEKEIGYADIIALRADPQGWASYPCAKVEWGQRPLLAFTDPTTSSTGRSLHLALYAIAAGKDPEDLDIGDVDDPDVVALREGVPGSGGPLPDRHHRPQHQDISGAPLRPLLHHARGQPHPPV